MPMGSALNFLSSSLALFRINLILGDQKKILNQIKDVVCYNQGELAQYSYLAGEKHKAMKDELKKSSPDIVNVKKFKTELERHLNEKLSKIAKENFAQLKRFYNGHSKREPRVCIKAARDGKVIDLFREEDQLYIKNYGIKENKGFSHVNDTGKYYLCNNIPYEIKQRRYYNPRLDMHKALLYSSPKLNWLRQRLCQEDTKWIDCWEIIKNVSREGGETPTAEQCYKSTLITPMTLLGNTLSKEFMDQFRMKSLPERAIYGFLCIDHHHTNYFKNDIDVPLSYIFADLISLYLITNLTYTEYSKTYEQAESLIGKGQNKV
jgi:hypothetical protein